MSDTSPYNPLGKENIGASVAEALLGRRPQPLKQLPSFKGAGIYAIYYTGAFQAYSAITARNRGEKFEAPIYVGKAVPQGARKGGFGLHATSTKALYLYNRLGEHSEGIQAVENLHIKDFHCRFLVVDDIWIPLGESLLISKFAPIWNSIIDGFGNHDPGKGRYQGMRPRWDVLHPGRPWALKCQERPENSKQIAAEVKEYLRATPLPINAHFYAEQSRKGYEIEQRIKKTRLYFHATNRPKTLASIAFPADGTVTDA